MTISDQEKGEILNLLIQRAVKRIFLEKIRQISDDLKSETGIKMTEPLVDYIVEIAHESLDEFGDELKKRISQKTSGRK